MSRNSTPYTTLAERPVVEQPSVNMQPVQMAAPAGIQLQSGKWKGLVASGIIQIVLGALTAILGTVRLWAPYYPYGINIASPIWGGILFYIVAGILGIVSGARRDANAATAHMIMSILACFAASFVIGFSSNAISYATYSYYYSTTVVAIDGTLIALGVIEFVVAIVGASLTCGFVCKPVPTHNLVYYPAQPHVIVAGQPLGVVSNPTRPAQQQFVYQAQQPGGPPQGQF